jgi:hypothetical protein
LSEPQRQRSTSVSTVFLFQDAQASVEVQLQWKSDQKRVEKEIKRIRNALEAGEFAPHLGKRVVILDCAKEHGVNEDAKLQEVLNSITKESGNDPVITGTGHQPLLAAAQGGRWNSTRKTKEFEAEAKKHGYWRGKTHAVFYY